MNVFQHARKLLLALMLVLVIGTTSCSTGVQERTGYNTGTKGDQSAQVARGTTGQSDNFADWVISTSKGLVKDAYVRDNDKLGVVISRDVRPTEVKPLAKSLVQGFHRSAPNRDLTVLVYAPDKKLILTARYDQKTREVEYSG